MALDPILTYMSANPDFVLVKQAVGGPGGPLRDTRARIDHAVVRVAEQFVHACNPEASPRRRAARALMVLAAVEGTMQRLAVTDDTKARSALIRELKHSLVAYLESAPD